MKEQFVGEEAVVRELCQKPMLIVWVGLCLSATTCGKPEGSGDQGAPALGDTDGDGIPDNEEGREDGKDTDGDGIPDYQDLDSDNDGIPDSVEVGAGFPDVPPRDSDGDRIPDHVDTDSDNNGIPDEIEGTDDFDGDGRPNYRDFDDDGDFINDSVEIGSDPGSPRDTDGDGAFDYLDIDSDGDTISDLTEGRTNIDGDDLPAYRDLDSDGDCRPDIVEAGDTDINTEPRNSDDDPHLDFLDLDSDNDAIPDSQEDVNCDGQRTGSETDALVADTDNDGASDLIEVTAGTDPNDPGDNPTARGDFVFVVPYEEPPTPAQGDLDFATNLAIVDLYVLIDRSGSMQEEISSVRDNLSTVVENLTCPPLGSGDPASCIPDLWSGSGSIGYRGSGFEAYDHHLDIQPDASLTGPAIETSEPDGCCKEILTQALWSTCTGEGPLTAGCLPFQGSYLPRLTCSNSPAGSSGVGYPCFRENALPVILFTTDEAISDNSDIGTASCPSTSFATNAANAIGAKVIGIQGDGGEATLTMELEGIATATGAVDALNGNAPLVFDGTNANAAGAIQAAVQTLRDGVPLDVNALALDAAGDAVDAVDAFVSRLETLQLGTEACPDGYVVIDTNQDSYPDQYENLAGASTVCWRLTPKENTTVMPTTQAQLYRAEIQVRGDGVTLLDSRDVYFLVPPKQPDIVIE